MSRVISSVAAVDAAAGAPVAGGAWPAGMAGKEPVFGRAAGAAAVAGLAGAPAGFAAARPSRRRMRPVAIRPYRILAASNTLRPLAWAIAFTLRWLSILERISHSLVLRLI